MIDKLFVETKLSYIQAYFEELEDILVYPDKEIQKDFLKLRALERIFQLIVDEMIDINNHIVRYAQKALGGTSTQICGISNRL